MLRCFTSKKELVSPLTLIQGVVDKKTVMSLLKNVYLRTDATGLVLEGTDLERSIRCTLPCEVKEEGDLLVDAKQLYEIVKEFPSDEIQLWEDEKKWLHIEGAERARYELGGVDATDFPRFMELPGGDEVELEGEVIARMVEKTIYASASTISGEDRYGFSSMLVEFLEDMEGDGTVIRSVCTNGHRLALLDQRLEGKEPLPYSVLIPRKNALEMRRIAEAVDGEFIFKADDKFCYMASHQLTLIVRLTTKADFPQYKLILPQEKAPHAVIPKEEFYNALKRVTIVTADGLDTRGVIATFSADSLALEPIQKERGNAREVIPVELRVDEEMRLAFNARYMMEALAVMESGDVMFSYPNVNAPCFLWGEEDPGYLAFIMPLKIENGEE